MKAKASGLLALVALFALPQMASASLQLQSYSAARHDRFYSGSDKAFIGQDYDWSGVGKVTTSVGGTTLNHWATMISPSYFLASAHFKPAAGDTVTFYDPSGTAHSYTVDSFSYTTTYNGKNSDLLLGKLTSAIPAADNIAYYPVVELNSYDDYPGVEFFVYGASNRVGRNVIDSVLMVQEKNAQNVVTAQTIAMEWDFDTPGGLGADEAYLMPGDSGAPNLMAIDGQLALLGINYYNETGSSPGINGSNCGSSLVSYYLSQLDGQMIGESIQTVPEPATLALLAAGLGPILAASRRRRRAA